MDSLIPAFPRALTDYWESRCMHHFLDYKTNMNCNELHPAVSHWHFHGPAIPVPSHSQHCFQHLVLNVVFFTPQNLQTGSPWNSHSPWKSTCECLWMNPFSRLNTKDACWTRQSKDPLFLICQKHGNTNAAVLHSACNPGLSTSWPSV